MQKYLLLYPHNETVFKYGLPFMNMKTNILQMTFKSLSFIKLAEGYITYINISRIEPQIVCSRADLLNHYKQKLGKVNCIHRAHCLLKYHPVVGY